MLSKLLSSSAAFAILLAAPLVAQEPPDSAAAPVPPAPPAAAGGEELVDRVVAVVGDTVLLLSDVQAELQQMQAAGQTIPQDAAGQQQLTQQLITQRVDQLILIEAARDAGIEIRADEINDLVDQDIGQVRQRFSSEAELRTQLAASGLSLEEYRAILGGQYRDRMLTERFLRSRAPNGTPPPVSEGDIQQMFDAQRATLGERPANVSFRQVSVGSQPSDSAKAAANQRAETALAELQEGADFEVLARRYSDDPGSREGGGDLGWFKPGRMVPEFERVAFALRPGQTSGIVESDFGFHIIRVEKVRGAERQARHILFTPEVNDADRERAKQRADSVATAARAGADFAALARLYKSGDDRDLLERIPLDRLPPAYSAAMDSIAVGDVAGPFMIEEGGRTQWVVTKLNERQAAGDYVLADVREQIRQRLEQQKMVEQLVRELRDQVYVRVML